MLIVFGLPELSRSHYLKRVQENQGALCFEGKGKGKAKLALSGLLGGLWAVSGVVGSAGACLAFRGLSCWGDSWALCLWFRFWAWGVCGLWVVGGELVGCAQSREFGASAHRLPRFVVLGNFSDSLPVVSILDMVYDFVSGFAVLKGLNSEHLF